MSAAKLNRIQIIKLVVAGIAALIWLDFLMPGKTFIEPIHEIQSKQQRYYNAAANSHYTYHAVTEHGNILLDEDLRKSVSSGDTLVFRKSFVFQADNGSYALKSVDESFRRHNMRWFSGLVFPFFIIFIMLNKWRTTTAIGNFDFVMIIFLLADLALLLFI